MSSTVGLPPDAFLHAVLDNVGVALVVVDSRGKIVFTNQAAPQMFGRESLEGLSVDEWRRDYVFRDMEGQPIPAEKAPILHALAGEQVSPQDLDVTLPDGRRKWLHAAGHHFSIFGMSGALVVITDETEQIELRRALERAHNAEAFGLLVGGAAHDLNNLISIISTTVALIRTEENVPETVRARLGQLTVAVQQGAARVNRLLRQRSVPELQRRPIQINDLINVTLELARPVLKDRVLVKAELGSLPAVEIDPLRIKHVLLNLILNAVDAMPQGGALTLRTEMVGRAEMGEIELDQDLRDGATSFVCVTVADTGIGIPQKLQGRIFDPFFTTKPFGKGSGLGLASAYAVVREHGGYIRVQSAPGAETKFTIYFPVEEKVRSVSKQAA